MALPSRLLVLLTLPLLAACGAAPLKSAPTAEIAPEAKPPADVAAPIAPEAKPPAEKPSSKRPTSLPGSPIRFEGGEGSSKETAVVIRGARGESDGVAAEYQYLDLLYGRRPAGWTVIKQALLMDQGKKYDALEIARSGKHETLYFDITEYFGK